MILKYMIDEHELSRVAPKAIKVVIYNDYFTRTLWQRCKKKILRYYVTDLGNGATNALQAQLLLVKAFVQS